MKLEINKQFWLNYYQYNKAVLFLIALILLILMFPRTGKFRYEFQKGKPWQHNDLIANADIPILKPESEILSERKTALQESFLYFAYDDEAGKLAEESFLHRFDSIAPSHLNRDFDNAGTLRQMAKTWLDSLYIKGIIENSEELKGKNEDFAIALMHHNEARVVRLGEVFTINTANEWLLNRLSTLDHNTSSLLLPMLQESLAFNLFYDQTFSETQKKQAVERISLTRGMIKKGEKVIGRGEVVTEEKYLQLQSIKQDYESQSLLPDNYRMIVLGRVILISMALLVFALFMNTFRHDIFIQNRNTVLLLSLIVMMISFTTLLMNQKPEYLMIAPICLIPIMVRTFYDTRLALFVHIITIIILGFLVPNSFKFLFMQLITGVITIISVVQLQKRSQFFFTSLMIFLSYSTIYVGLTLMEEGSIKGIDFQQFVYFGASALLTLFSYPLIYLFERVFGMVTNVSLIELADTNTKLLKELALNAPGTFQHSLIVSNIAEEAARAIGANALLARAGSLYHDIGKMENPIHFIENQAGSNNPHDELESDVSASIITGHVLRGIETARLNKLPESIIDFIRTHHGTRSTQYFKNKFIAANPHLEPDINLFHYKGPIPFSKETSIVMMADTIEATSRSLKAPDAHQVDHLVENTINHLLEIGQLRNSPLTLKEITLIKKIIKRKLLSIYHIRIEYPQAG